MKTTSHPANPTRPIRALIPMLALVAMLAPILGLTGCSLVPQIRKLPVPKPPAITKNATPEQLVDALNKRWNGLQTLTAWVDMQATVFKSKEGSQKDYPTLRGNILMRKPAMLRVLGRYLAMPAFDMVSDGEQFTLSIPEKKKVIKGLNKHKSHSVNALENLRPDFFLDSLLVRGLEPNDEYMVVEDSKTIEDPERKHLFAIPEYKLTIMQHAGDGHKLLPLRVVYFHREDLLPYQQDIYDTDGVLETQVFYANYQDFDGSLYPSSIIIKRPVEEIQIVMQVEKITENQPMPDDQFVPKTAEGSTIQKLE
jgi:outer membrane lipoprotein-sorting protein